MPLIITEQMFGNVNTIAIPADAIFIISLLIAFVLTGYFFNNIISNKTNQVAQKIEVDSNLKLVKNKLEDQLKVNIKTLSQNNIEKPSIKKLNFIPPSKLLKLGSLTFVAMGGASLLGFQHIQKSYESWNTSQANIKVESQSTKSPLSMVDVKPLYKSQNNIQRISYIDPFLSTTKSSKDDHYYPVKEKHLENNFSFK